MQRLTAVHNYVKSNIEWDGYRDFYAGNLKKILEQKKGSSGDINLLLGSMLQKAGFDIDMVLLSTRDHGFIREQFPMVRQFNYTVCRLKAGDKYIFLDATDKQLPVNVLPERCLNGRGLIISKTNHGWVELDTKTKAKTTISAVIELDESGLMKSKLELMRDGYDANKMRKAYLTKGKETYIKDFVGSAGTFAPELKTDFVSSQFNHAVVAVPNGADTLWLECTSQTKPFGYAGLFTGDRKALLIIDQGAKIAYTPKYTADQNIQFCSADVTLEKTGNGKAKVKTVYAGLQYENSSLDAILNNQHDEQKKWVQQNTKIPSFDIIGFSLNNHKNRLPSATVDLELALTRFANVSGKRIFLTPNLLNRNTYVPEAVAERKSKVVRRIGFTDIDTIRYHLPEEIYPEFLPETIKIQSRFGEYEANFLVEQGKLLYIRKLRMNKGEYPPSSYQELIDFYRGITKADNIKMVFMSKT